MESTLIPKPDVITIELKWTALRSSFLVAENTFRAIFAIKNLLTMLQDVGRLTSLTRMRSYAETVEPS
jgi:hypothetical protein